MGASRLVRDRHKADDISVCPRPNSNCHSVQKRAFDIIVATVALLALAPVMIMIAAALRMLGFNRPIFTQHRVGRNATIFTIYKFRTLRDQTCRPVSPIITKSADLLTARLRISGLDELPQLFNVLRGEMSLVGPRPHSLADHALFSSTLPGYESRLTAKPGITGWAQINGWRGPVNDHQQLRARIAHDLDYISRQSARLDGTILLATALLPFQNRAIPNDPAHEGTSDQSPDLQHDLQHDRRFA